MAEQNEIPSLLDSPNLIAPSVLEGMPEITIARSTLGLVLYLDQPAVWARGGAAAALAAYLRYAPGEQLTWYTTSMIGEWHRISPSGFRALVESISTPWLDGRNRHLFRFRIVDDVWAPSLGFTYREVDPARGRRTGVVEIMLPQTHDPNDLLQIAIEIGQEWPIHSGIGGYLASWNEWKKPVAFGSVYRWCRRCIGLDVQDPDQMAWFAAQGLPGTNWLTLIGASLQSSLPVDTVSLYANDWATDVMVLPLQRALLLRAGDAPTLGDLNRLVYPSAYAEVARTLAPYVIQEPPRYFGGFWDEEQTPKWFRRFIDPEGWR